MKTHFSRFLIAMLSIGALFSGSCKDDEVQSETMFDDIVLNFSRTARTEQVDLPIDQISNYWHVYSPSTDQWLSWEVIPGHRSLYVYADGNTTGSIRSSYIMVRSGNLTQRILVNQDSDSRISLSQNRINLRYLISTETVKIQGTEEIDDLRATAESKSAGDDGWLSVILEDNILHITAMTNPNDMAREGIVSVSGTRRISGETVSEIITVYQGRGGMTPYEFDIPDFSESKVYVAMDGDKPVAQITKELLRKENEVNDQAIVVYPINDNGEVELGMGYIAQVLLRSDNLTNDSTKESVYTAPTGSVHGGSVAFSVNNNTISGYTRGTLAEPVTHIYMPGDVGMGPEAVPDSKQAVVKPLLLTDQRNTEEFIYPVVKICTQYWMGGNLKTAYYNKNKDFAAIPTNKTPTTSTSSLANATSFVCVYGNMDALATDAVSIENRNTYGLLYSYAAIGGYESLEENTVKDLENIADNISPEGWIVPTSDDFENLIAYVPRSLPLGQLDANPITSENNITGFGSRKTYYLYPRSSALVNFALGGSFYASYHSRTRNDNGSSPRAYTYALQDPSYDGGSKYTTIPNRAYFNRAFAIRCLNDGAIKIAQ